MSLGMTLNGAGGETRDQMRRMLGFGELGMPAINEGYRALPALLQGLDPATSFRIANSIWHDQAYPFLPAFLDAGRTYFGAEIRGVDFGDAEGTKRQVNAWVRDATNGRIPTIVDEVRRDDVMYVVNAIWFKGAWRSRFDPAKTRDAPFHAADGTTSTVRMMQQRADTTMRFRYAADAELAAGELPYGNGAYAMVVLLPREGTSIDAFAESLTADRWRAVLASLRPQSGIDIALPRFTMTFERELKPDLVALGMRDAFDPARADLSGMTARGDLFVGFVKHKAFVQVDEEGTEAAAVTNTGIQVTSAPPSFRVDRPFVFVIHERLSGTVLFVGKVARL
jgi:serpin B